MSRAGTGPEVVPLRHHAYLRFATSAP